MKNYTILILTIIFFISCNEVPKKVSEKNDNTHSIEWINFKWHKGTLGGKFYDKLGINIPIKINDTANFYAQFDLGANTNMLYEDTLKKYFDIQQTFNVDTVNTEAYYYWLNTPNIHIGNRPSSLSKWIVRNDYDADGVIGTIGAEELQNKCLLINYPEQLIAITDSIPSSYLKEFNSFNFEIKNKKVILTATINHKEYRINYDTGSSITPLLVSDINLYNDLTDSKIANDTLRGFTSWGTHYESIPGAAIKDHFIIGNIDLGNQIVYYLDSDYHRKLYLQDNIVALAGSVLFYENEIYIDFKHKKMGIKNLK